MRRSWEKRVRREHVAKRVRMRRRNRRRERTKRTKRTKRREEAEGIMTAMAGVVEEGKMKDD